MSVFSALSANVRDVIGKMSINQIHKAVKNAFERQRRREPLHIVQAMACIVSYGEEICRQDETFEEALLVLKIMEPTQRAVLSATTHLIMANSKYTGKLT